MSVDPASGQTLFDRVAASMFVAVLALVDPPDSPDCGAFPSQVRTPLTPPDFGFGGLCARVIPCLRGGGRCCNFPFPVFL